MRWLAAFACLIAISGCWAGAVPSQNMSVVFFDVGQGDSALIITPDRRNVLIDCGKGNETAGYLKQMNITEIDALIITHPDNDHAGGCASVMDSANVLKVITNSNTKNDFLLGVSEFVDMEVIVAYDSHGRFEGSNDNSVLLRARYGKTGFLFTGDCESRCENELIKTQSLNADVLKVGHHGSRHSSASWFLQKVKPAIAVISVGENTYGHPAGSAIGRLAESGAKVYRTDKDGTVVVTSDGKECSVS